MSHDIPGSSGTSLAPTLEAATSPRNPWWLLAQNGTWRPRFGYWGCSRLWGHHCVQMQLVRRTRECIFIMLTCTWFQVYLFVHLSTKNCKFKLGYLMIMKCAFQRRRTVHILHNNLLARFMTFKYLDKWYIGFHLHSWLRPHQYKEQTKWNHQICVMIPAQVRFQQLEKSWKEPKGHFLRCI